MTDKHFIDWQSELFGHGYGTGEQYTLQALKDFFSILKEKRSYDYEEVEKKLGKTAAWLLIEILCQNAMIEYGTSPRYGWLTDKGELVRAYCESKTTDQLYELAMVDSDYIHCYASHCNCDAPCLNPLFKM